VSSKERGIATLQLQLVWDAMPFTQPAPSLSTKSRSRNEPIQVLRWTLSGFGLDRIPTDKLKAILAAFPRLALRTSSSHPYATSFAANRRPSFDNILRDFGTRYVEGFTPPNFADVVANSPFSE